MGLADETCDYLQASKQAVITRSIFVNNNTVSVTSGAVTSLTSGSLSPGLYLIIGTARMTPAATDTRCVSKISISTSSTSFDNAISAGCASEPSFASQLCVVGLKNFSSTTTVHLTCYHQAGGSREFTGMRLIAMKISEYDSMADNYGLTF